MTDAERLVERLLELRAKATQGPWSAERDGIRELSNITAFIKAGKEIVSYGHLSFENRDLIVETVNALPALAATIQQQAARIGELEGALEPFANVAAQIRKTGTDARWLEKVLFYMGDDNDPTKWSLTGRAFDTARRALGRE